MLPPKAKDHTAIPSYKKRALSTSSSGEGVRYELILKSTITDPKVPRAAMQSYAEKTVRFLENKRHFTEKLEKIQKACAGGLFGHRNIGQHGSVNSSGNAKMRGRYQSLLHLGWATTIMYKGSRSSNLEQTNRHFPCLRGGLFTLHVQEYTTAQ